MKILIAVPCMDTVPVPFTESMLNLAKPEGTKACFKSGSLIYDSRNLLAFTAIENHFDYIMWFDSDMTFSPDILIRMLDDVQQTHAHMVTGLYFKRTYPSTPVIFQNVQPPSPNEHGQMQINIKPYTDYPRDRIFPVEGCGFGCVLTSVPLVKAVIDKFGPAFTPILWAGEDISFCYRVNQLAQEDPAFSNPIMCDSRIKCGHVGQYIFTEDPLKRGDNP